jgi:DinB superfamily/Pentapeptide repeats (8 copies)
VCWRKNRAAASKRFLRLVGRKTAAYDQRMPDEEFEGDLSGAVFWGADLTGAMFRDVKLSDVTITHASLVNVDIDAFVDKVVVNGVDVTAYVNERDEWYPLRSMLTPADPAAMRATWAALEEAWADTTALAFSRPEAALHESVNGEFTFVETFRHVVFAIDKWFTVPVLGLSFDPTGLPNKGSLGFPWPGLDYALRPTASEALDTFADRVGRVRRFLASVESADFMQTIEVLENGPHALRDCLHTVFEEAFWHNRYARRDLAMSA